MDKRDFLKTLAAGGMGGVAAAATLGRSSTGDQTRIDKYRQRFDEILGTRKIRAGWAAYEPFFMRDPVTQQFSGIFYDLTVKIGELAEWQLDWAPESTFATIGSDLDSGKFDIYCGGLWPNVGRATLISFSEGAFYSGVEVYCRPETVAKIADVTALNNPAYKMAVIDGEMSMAIKRSDFPLSQTHDLPQNTPVSDLMLNVTSGKADFAVVERVVALEYMEKTSSRVERPKGSKPIRAFPSTFGVARDNLPLLNVLEVALRELISSGEAERILRKYEKYPQSYYRTLSTFQSPD
jgi:ABC-type amino acid transport substrate-binding protein